MPLDPDDVYWDDQFGPTALSGNGDLPVYASVVDGNDLYLAGDFLYAGDLVVNHIVKWDGTHWENFGSGITPSQWGNPIVQSIVPLVDDIYCGGTFEMAGGKPSSFIARNLKWPVGVTDPENKRKSFLNLKNFPNPCTQSTIISWQSSVISQQSYST